MFQKVHLRLTLLCAAITICIFCVSAGFYLYLAENTLKESHTVSFQRDIDKLRSDMEQQELLTHQYLLRLEQGGPYVLYLWDNETPLSFNSLKQHSDYGELPELAFSEMKHLDTEALSSEGDSPGHLEFIVTAGNGLSYDVSCVKLTLASSSNASLTAGQTGLTLLVFSSREDFLSRLDRQRLQFILFAVSGCILLTLFSWFFTGRLLRPIREAQLRQIQFVANASHELRTPLSVVRSCISVQPPNYHETIQRECIRMGRLVDDMLTLTGLETHNRSLQNTCFSPDTLLLNLFEEMQPLAQERRLKLDVKLPEDTLPSVSGDSERITQVLRSLVQNALSYTPAGGRVTLEASVSHKAVAFRIIDNGPGIPDKDKKRVFERFYRSDAARGSGGHFGLGLCIAKEIVQAHHGSLTVSDTPGGGSTFTCCLPLS